MRRGTGETSTARAAGVEVDDAPVTRLAPLPDLGHLARPEHDPSELPERWTPSPGATAVIGESPFGQPGLEQFAHMSVGEIAERAGLKRIDVVAWRDFDDPEAGGSELHAHRVMTAWSAAGLDVSMTTSSVPGGRTVVRRDGYRVVRRAGRYSVFPRTILSGALGGVGAGDGLVRDLERHALLLPPLARCPVSSSCTTSTPRCGNGAAARAWPRAATPSSTAWPRRSTAAPGS